ncbi:serine/threonine protein kinase [Myxococcota bacterium]|nr:serine/threonine protein kinase [Myxococcota bacterium]
MGQVVLVTSPFIGTDREAAMKILDKSDMASEDSLERFHREAELLSMATHPNIAKFIEYFESDSYAYLVMEYVLGQDLEDFTQESGGKLDPVPVIDIILDILEALIYMYEEHGMSHRDLKPANILVRKNKAHIRNDRKHRGILIDFGNTKIIENVETESLTMMSGMMTGTPGYTAPSVTLDVFDEKDDVFSLAGTVMYALLGENPFEVPGEMQASMIRIMKGEFDLGEYEGTAIGSWIRINVAQGRHDRFTLRQAHNVLVRIRDNPMKKASENFVRTIASDDALVQITEKVDALHGAGDMNTMATGLMELGFEKSWLEDALLANAAPTRAEQKKIDQEERRHDSAPEYAIIDNLLKKKNEAPEKVVEDDTESTPPWYMWVLLVAFILQSGALAYLLLLR